MKKSKIVSTVSAGVLLMTLSNLIVKAAGLFFKIPLTFLIGEAGMGYFNSAYTIFTWLYMLSCAGLPTASSVLISKLPERTRTSGALRIFKVSLAVFTSFGAVLTLVMMLASQRLASLMRVESSAAAILAVAPALIFITQSSALRGYFQGKCDLRPHSVSQIAEALGKLILGVGLAYYAVCRGMDTAVASAYAAVGVVCGVALGTAVLYVAFLFSKKDIDTRDTTKASVIVERLTRLSLPIALSSSVMSLAGLIDSFIMTRSLHAAGLSQAETAAVWGNYSSLALPMFNLPPVLTMPIAYALLPMLSSRLAADDEVKARALTKDAFERTAILAVPSAVGMSVMAEPILKLLFDDGIAERGALMLTLLAPSSLLLCMLGLFNTVLQASGKERVPLYSMLAGAAVKLSATYILTPHIGKYATPISTLLCYLAAAVISLAAITSSTKLGPAFSPRVLILPITVSAAAVLSAAVTQPLLGTIAAVVAAAAVYFGTVGAVGVLGRWIQNKKVIKRKDTVK